MAERNLPHIILEQSARPEEFSKRAQGSSDGGHRPQDRSAHGRRLLDELEQARQAGLDRRARAPEPPPGAESGLRLELESVPAVRLALEPLESRAKGAQPYVVNVRTETRGDTDVEIAQVFVPDGKIRRFIAKVERYLETAESEKPTHRRLVDPISTIRLATVRSLWTDAPDRFPSQHTLAWWEVWLRRRDGEEADRLTAYLGAVGARAGASRLVFSDRVVVLVEASAEQLSTAVDCLDDITELRRPHDVTALLARETPSDQSAWVQQLADRLVPASDPAPSACILDTGVDAGHPLLERSLPDTHCHSCEPGWGTADQHGHGTEMAGLALFGDVGAAIASSGAIRLRHGLESVKLLPRPSTAGEPPLFGARTATAAALVEIDSPDRRRVFTMAVTTPGTDASPATGQPTAWSAAVDALATGASVDVSDAGITYLDRAAGRRSRLFVVSAGNVHSWDPDHLARSDIEVIEDPGQAWNAVTVGAYTDLDDCSTEVGFQHYMPLAPRGELSPHSRTGTAFARTWPHKPDVVLEGGNIARAPGGDFDTPTSLQLLTTQRRRPGGSSLTTTCATSAATAQAAHLVAEIQAAYPALSAETVRALLVHSARWTPTMERHLSGPGGSPKQRARIVRRRYGMGVPDRARAVMSASDSLTMVVEDVIHPFDGRSRMREMHLHELPWPGDTLQDLGSSPVTLRVTLSYFVEPNPSRRGWRGRYRYASHGLRFDLRRALESTDTFRKRINDKALGEDERRPASTSDSGEWLFGSEQRSAGSLHCDIWQGTAADLAARGLLAIYPVSGWWKDDASRDASEAGARYAVVVSIEAPDVDVYTPVAVSLGIPVQVTAT